MGRGVLFDLAVLPWLLLPWALYDALVPEFTDRRSLIRLESLWAASWGMLYLSLFVVTAISEFAFWAEFATRFDVFALIDEYLDLLEKKNAQLPDGFAEVNREAEAIRRLFDEHPADIVPCHCDPLPENFLDTGERMYIVDWEYAGNIIKFFYPAIPLFCPVGISMKIANRQGFYGPHFPDGRGSA